MTGEKQQDEDDDKRGSLDILRVFQAAAARLMLAVDEGRILHGTLNIRDSGAPLEAAFRDFLKTRLPHPFDVHHGYLYDPRSICTPQIDLVVSDAEQSAAMFAAEDGAIYTPFNAAYVVGEIKASGSNIVAHLTQISDRLNAVDAMYKEISATLGSGIKRPDMLSVLFIADAGKVSFKGINQFLNDQANARPNYIVLLSKAELIAGTNAIIVSDDLQFAERGQDYAVYGPPPEVGGEGGARDRMIVRRGHVLLWLFYAIVHHLQMKGPGRGIQPLFAEAIERRYPLQKLRDLSAARRGGVANDDSGDA